METVAFRVCLFVGFQLESSRKLEEIKTLHEKIRVSTEEAKKKEEMYKQLVTTRISRPPSRVSS